MAGSMACWKNAVFSRAEQLAANQLIDGDGLFLIWWMPYTRLWRDGWSTIEIVLEESLQELELLETDDEGGLSERRRLFCKTAWKRLRCGKDFAVQINLCR